MKFGNGIFPRQLIKKNILFLRIINLIVYKESSVAIVLKYSNLKFNYF